MDIVPKKPGPALFVAGFLAPFRSIRLVRRQKGLKRYFVLPFIINIALLSTLIWLSWVYVYPFLTSFIPGGDAWYLSLLRWLATPFLLLALTVFLVFFYSIGGSIATAPFNDPLSGKVEKILRGRAHEEAMTLRLISGDILRMIVSIIKLLVIIAGFNIFILLFHLVPVVGGIVYSILSFLSALFFFGFNFFDYPLERRRFDFKGKFALLWRYRYMTMGVGLAFWALSLVPLLGFMALNLGTVGATVLFLDHVEPRPEDTLKGERK